MTLFECNIHLTVETFESTEDGEYFVGPTAIFPKLRNTFVNLIFVFRNIRQF